VFTLKVIEEVFNIKPNQRLVRVFYVVADSSGEVSMVDKGR